MPMTSAAAVAIANDLRPLVADAGVRVRVERLDTEGNYKLVLRQMGEDVATITRLRTAEDIAASVLGVAV